MPASPIRKLAPLADAAKQRGIHVFHLNIGQPDLPTPQVAIDAIRNIDRKVLEYSPSAGYRSYREKLVGYYDKYNIKLTADDIIITSGGSEAVLFSFMACLNPGDEIIVPEPAYANYMAFAISAGARIRTIATTIEEGFSLPKVEKFEELINERTRAILICNPNNPTGTVYTRKELEELAAFCVEHDLICVCDQAFEDTVFPEHEMICICQLPGMWERTVTVCSVSKGMGLSGFRVGWTYATDTIMDTYYGAAVNIQGATSTLAQLAVMPAFRDDSFIQDYMKKYDNRRKYAYKLFNNIPGVSMQMPESGFFVWIDISKLGDSSEITAYLAKEALVSLNDGKFYGDMGNGHLRLIAGCFWDDKDSFAAMDRMAAAFRKLAEKKGLA